MLHYSFVGSKPTGKRQLQAFLADTQADEFLAASTMYDLKDRLKSARLFAEVMQALNEGR